MKEISNELPLSPPSTTGMNVCPKCGRTYFRDNGFTRCIGGNCEIITEDEYKSTDYHSDKPVIKCPHCKSTDIKSISGSNSGVPIAMFGIFSKKINKAYKFLNCKCTW